jgi:phosphatidylserine decarboxylase
VTFITRVFARDAINFALTNWIPRRLATRLMGWFSRIEHPLVTRVSLAIWQRFGGDLQLHEARRTRFASVHDCFIRELKDGVRPIDCRRSIVISPCDAIVMQAGRIDCGTLIQAKGLTYTLDDLLTDASVADQHHDGTFVTLRLTSTMYHRFHAPADCEIDEVIYVAGDMWNVNLPAVQRIDRLYCRNERAVIRTRLSGGEPLTLVPVAAILVASIRLRFLDVLLNVKYRGPNRIRCQARFDKGDELGYFHHGSTIIVLGGSGMTVCDGIREGARIRMGQPLLERDTPAVPTLA